MRQLLLLRHAKSSWDDPLAEDFDRPLNARGRKSAEAVGAWLRAQNLQPDEVLCSAAARTVETWRRLGIETEAKFSQGLYHAGADRMLSALRKAGGERVMLVGHNPGIGMLAAMLVRDAPAHPRFGDFPTAALLVLEFDIADWSALTPRQGRVLHFLTPHDLLEGAPAP